MGILQWLGFSNPVRPTLSIQSPYAPPDTLVSLAIAELLGGDAAAKLTIRETALKVPGLKRAHRLHCSLVAGLNFRQMTDELVDPDNEQPKWLTSSASGIAPYHRTWGLVSDLFMNGWGCLGFTSDRSDAMHIPYGWWGIERGTGNPVVTNPAIPLEYRDHLVAIPMGYGENGILVDGHDTIQAALRIESVWMERINNPMPATDLHITDPKFDDMSAKEKRRIVDQWNANRARSGGQTAVTQSFLQVNALGTVSADLFEKGRNAIRLDIANHSAVPASLLEGAKEGKNTGEITYSNSSTSRNELYDFGTAAFVQAIESRLSLDDVCAPGKSIRADLTALMSDPTPNTDLTNID